MIHWLASYPKSGNTWVRLLLNAYWFNHINLNQLYSCSGDLNGVYYQNVSPKPIGELTENEIIHLRNAALLQIENTWQTRPTIVKTHFANLEVHGVSVIPAGLTEQAFYVVRDPRDIVMSYANHYRISLDIAVESMINILNHIGANNFKHNTSSWAMHVATWLQPRSYPVHVIKYEDIHKNPHEILRGILEKLGFDPQQDKIDKAVKLTNFYELQNQEHSVGFREAPPDRRFFREGRIGHWKNVLSTKQIDAITGGCGVMMEKLGYI